MTSKCTDNDYIAKLFPESVVFSVQGELFRVRAMLISRGPAHSYRIAMQIPCALLQLNSEGFASMLSSSHPLNDSPIELDDPLEAFRDFRDMLFTYDLIPVAL